MGASLVYAGLYASVLASLPSVRTELIAFDTSVVRLTEQLQGDPVDLLFGLQLGGGTDIHRALAYCASLVRNARDTVLVLLSDLFDGASPRKTLGLAAQLVNSGVQVIVLLALDDDGTPAHDRGLATSLATLGVPCFACTPDMFPSLMAEAIERRDIHGWASRQGIVSTAGSTP